MATFIKIDNRVINLDHIQAAEYYTINGVPTLTVILDERSVGNGGVRQDGELLSGPQAVALWRLLTAGSNGIHIIDLAERVEMLALEAAQEAANGHGD